MISVVIPLYNKEEFIVTTINSVLNQTFQDFELIIVDDGSTDRSIEALTFFNDKRIKLFQIQNSGVSIARNFGIEKAQYSYIAFLDADDWWATTYLEAMYDAINKYPKQKIFASSRSRVFKDNIERYDNQYLPKENTTDLISYFDVISVDLPPINSSNSVFHKSLFSEIGKFKERVSQHEDHDLWIRLAATYNIVFVNKPLSFYRKTEQNTASNKHYSASNFISYLDTMQNVLPKLDGNEKRNFLRYTNRFILFSFIQNTSKYHSKDRKVILNRVNGLVSKKNEILLKIASQLSFLQLYRIYKRFS